MKARNRLFTILVCLFLLGPALMWIAQSKAHLDLPSWLTAEDATYLSGSKPEDLAGRVNLHAFIDGTMQEAVEGKVEDCIPIRATALLTNASTQRDAIAASNILFRWACYPTFYGSDVVYCPSDNRMLDMPQQATTEELALCDTVAKNLNSFAVSHPEIRTLVYLSADSSNAENSPVLDLTSNPLTYQKLESVFLQNAPSCVWISGGVSYNEIKEGWFRTDHHWNAAGSFEAYRRISEALGVTTAPEPTYVKTYEQPHFRGALARRGLMSEPHDELTFYQLDGEENLSASLGPNEEKSVPLQRSKIYNEGRWRTNRYHNHYSSFYHTDYESIVIRNEANHSKKNLIIIGDSYSNCMERFLALQYDTTYVIDPRKTDLSLSETVASIGSASDVLFIMKEQYLCSEKMLRFTR